MTPGLSKHDRGVKRFPHLRPFGGLGTAPFAACGSRLSAPSGGVEAAPKKARHGWARAAIAVVLALTAPGRTVSAADDEQAQGVWMIEDEVAIAVDGCGGDALCERVVWLRAPRDGSGRPRQDEKNPDAAQRDRPLCGLTVLGGLLPVPDEPGRWDAGSFYDPRDGRSYGLTATAVSADVLLARVYIGMPFLGLNQPLVRVQRSSGEGWC